MNKKVLKAFAFLFCLLFFVLHLSSVYAETSSEKQVQTEKTVSGLITKIKIEPCPKKKEDISSAATPPVPCPGLEDPRMRTDIKEYVVNLASLGDRYEIILDPYTLIKAGDKSILPCNLKANEHFIAVTYGTGDKTKITGVTLEKAATPSSVEIWSIIGGLLITGILFLFINNLLKRTGFSGLIVGFDKRYSNSKFQMTIWFFLVIGSYITLYIERFIASTSSVQYSTSIGIPENLGILMGISAGSFVGAKAITFSKVQAGTTTKPISEAGPTLTDLVSNDYKAIDLGDAQMFAWTLVAISIYIMNFLKMLSYLNPSPVSLPEVDSTLLVLTGVSQAAYIGKKLVTSDIKPTITSVDPKDGAKAKDRITINGTAFGTSPGIVIIGQNTDPNTRSNLNIISWYDAIIQAEIPPGTTSGKTVLCIQTAFNQMVTCSYNIL